MNNLVSIGGQSRSVMADPGDVKVVSLHDSQTVIKSGWDLGYNFGYWAGYQKREEALGGGRQNVDILYNSAPSFYLDMDVTEKAFPSSNGFVIISDKVAYKNSRLIKSRKDKKRINTDKGGVAIEGKVLAASEQLDILLIDETLGAGLQKMSKEKFGGIRPYADFPKMKLGFRDELKVKSIPLDGWNEILEKLEKGFGGDLFLNRLGVDAQFSPDGRYLAINIPITAHRSQSAIIPSHPEVPASVHQDLEHNWIGVWDTQSNRLVYKMTSRELDTVLDKERTVQSPFPVQKSKSSKGWKTTMDRKLSMRFTNSGELIVARAELQNFDLEEADIYLKVIRIMGGMASPVYEANMGKFKALYRGDLTRGISQMLIASDGTSVAISTPDLSETDWRVTDLAFSYP